MHPVCPVLMQNAGRHRWRFPVPNACNAWRPMKQMASPFQGASGAVSVRIPIVTRISASWPCGIAGCGLCTGVPTGQMRSPSSPRAHPYAPGRCAGPLQMCGFFRNGSQGQALPGQRAGRKVPVMSRPSWMPIACRIAIGAPYPICCRDEGLPCRMRDIFQDVEDRVPARRADPGHGP
jgi:hypothetical protein